MRGLGFSKIFLFLENYWFISLRGKVPKTASSSKKHQTEEKSAWTPSIQGWPTKICQWTAFYSYIQNNTIDHPVIFTQHRHSKLTGKNMHQSLVRRRNKTSWACFLFLLSLAYILHITQHTSAISKTEYGPVSCNPSQELRWSPHLLIQKDRRVVIKSVKAS